MRRFILLVSLTTMLLSCKPEGRIYENHQELSPNVEWLKKDTREFKIQIEDNNPLYNLSLSFRYVEGYMFDIAKIKVTETSPSGQIERKEFDLKIREKNGDYIGEAGYDIWDSEHLVERDKKYRETGTYTYLVAHNMPNDPFYSVMEVGMILDKVVN